MRGTGTLGRVHDAGKVADAQHAHEGRNPDATSDQEDALALPAGEDERARRAGAFQEVPFAEAVVEEPRNDAPFLVDGLSVTSPLTERLRGMGADVRYGHATEHVGDVDLIVATAAVRPDNPELVEAKRRGIPVISRAAMVARLMEGRTGICVAGTHGKTTTSSMIAWMLREADRDPSFLLGGESVDLGTNAWAGEGDEIVVEVVPERYGAGQGREHAGSRHAIDVTCRHSGSPNLDERGDAAPAAPPDERSPTSARPLRDGRAGPAPWRHPRHCCP